MEKSKNDKKKKKHRHTHTHTLSGHHTRWPKIAKEASKLVARCTLFKFQALHPAHVLITRSAVRCRPVDIKSVITDYKKKWAYQQQKTQKKYKLSRSANLYKR